MKFRVQPYYLYSLGACSDGYTCSGSCLMLLLNKIPWGCATFRFSRGRAWLKAIFLNWYGYSKFSDADYADDVAAMEYDPTDIVRSLENIEAASSELGLHISWAKTKVQNLGAGPPAADLSVNGQTVEGVQSFVYLGSSISSADGSRSEQLRRIGIAASNMSNLDCIWRQPRLALQTKIRLYMSLIVPILLYASETWTLTKADTAHLQAFHMRCQRRLLGVHWFDKVKNVEITRRTGLSHLLLLLSSSFIFYDDKDMGTHITLKSTGRGCPRVQFPSRW